MASAPTKSKRILKPVHPDMGIPGALEWLGDSFALPAGYTVTHVERHGKQKIDPLTIHIGSSNGKPPFTVRFAEQRDAASPGSLRTTLSSETEGKIRMPHVGVVEATDVFAVLCLAAGAPAAQDARDEVAEWLEQVVDTAWTITGYSLAKDRRYDALIMLQRRGLFDVRRARALAAGTLANGDQHVLLVDELTGWRYLRSGEVAMYIRHMFGPPPMAQTTLDARLAEIGVGRVRYEERRGRHHPHGVFYVLPDVDGEGVQG